MKKILIVDDETEIRDLIKDFLVKENFETESACNGREALEKLADNHNDFDLVMLDIMMPEIDGMEMMKILRKSSIFRLFSLRQKMRKSIKYSDLK